MKKTKIICTLGPASNNRETIVKMIESGMNCARHNFSHGDHETHKQNMELVRSVNKELGSYVAVLQDTKGPEIRTNNFKGGIQELVKGNQVTIYMEEIEGDDTKFSVTYQGLVNDVEVGDRILIDDGLIGLIVEEKYEDRVVCRIRNTGIVKNKKGVNLPDSTLNIDFISPKDYEDIVFGCKMDVDYIAASFVRRKEDVLAIREILKEQGNEKILIISKIENQEGVDKIDEIIEVSDGIMVARGDLGVEIPLENVPLVQKSIIKKCNEAGKLVITATHLLDSMQKNPRPTRAESADVANAIIDGSDCVMLSGETAAGEYPVESVITMATIAERVEESFLDHKSILKNRIKSANKDVTEAIGIAVGQSVLSLESIAVVAATQSGHTAKAISRFRLPVPVIASTPYEKTCTRVALNWGVFPFVEDYTTSNDDIVNNAFNAVNKMMNPKKGDTFIITAGIPASRVKHTNFMKIEEF